MMSDLNKKKQKKRELFVFSSRVSILWDNFPYHHCWNYNDSISNAKNRQLMISKVNKIIEEFNSPKSFIFVSIFSFKYTMKPA